MGYHQFCLSIDDLDRVKYVGQVHGHRRLADAIRYCIRQQAVREAEPRDQYQRYQDEALSYCNAASRRPELQPTNKGGRRWKPRTLRLPDNVDGVASLEDLQFICNQHDMNLSEAVRYCIFIQYQIESKK